MISKSNFLQSPSPPTLPLTQTQQFHFRRRRRLKLPNRSASSISSQFEPLNTLQDLISVNSLTLIAPALGFAAGAALYLSSLKSNRTLKDSNDREDSGGEWTLLASPTPFNRFVFHRCPSIVIEGGGELSEKLMERGGPSVKVRVKDMEVIDDAGFDYQRICVSTDDGGVIALDWPETLDWREGHGWDTTVVIVPGTTEGSMDNNVRLLVCELVRCGCFPIVMNPRGCAGSPLTTARLFTAADSDDICTAIQFTNKARPSNTLMAVGLGHGANMLTKYLVEVAERTPLTAAACIDNPFDLEESKESFSYRGAVDQKLTSGLINILRSNKELFLGREKGFNVEEALSATSLRDFDREISMISYGFESIEEFYSESSTSEVVGKVKIPLLFIQTDDGTVPPFSIPRSSVAENPFTSMFLCSRIHSPLLTSEKSMLPWYEHFVIEWLTSVELGLLKGCHPLLKDVDVAIDPSASLTPAKSRVSNKNIGVKNSIKHDTTNNLHLESHRKISESAESRGEIGEMLEQSCSGDTASINNTVESLVDNKRSQGVNGERLDQSGSVAVGNNTGETSADNERGQVLQSAEVVMKMLDVSIPGTLQEEQKKKVLTSIEQGEKLMKALEGVVPEDVRGKLVTAVSEITTTQGTKLNLDEIMNISLGPSASSEEKGNIDSGMTVTQMSTKTAEGIQMDDKTNLDVSNDKNKPSSESEVEESPATSTTEPPQVQVESNSSKKDKEKNIQPIEGQNNQAPSESDEPAPSVVPVPDLPPSSVPDALTEFDDPQVAVNSVFGIVENMIDKLENDNAQENDEKQGKSEDGEPSSACKESPVSSDTEDISGMLENNNGLGLVSDQRQCKLPACNHRDKSTDVRQNAHIDMDEKQLDQGGEPSSTFKESPVSRDTKDMSGILENNNRLSIESDQRQCNHRDKSADVDQNVHIDMDEKQLDQRGEPSSTLESPVSCDAEDMSGILQNNNGLNLEADQRQCNHRDKSPDLHQNVHIDMDEKQLGQSLSTSLKKNNSSFNSFGNEKDKKDVTDFTLSAKTSDEVEHLRKFPIYVTVNPYRDSLCDEHLRPYLISPNAQSLDLSSTAGLLLDYLPKEGQWKFLNQTETNRDPDNCHGTQPINGRGQVIHSAPQANDTNKIIETSYIKSNTEKKQRPIKKHRIEGGPSEQPEEKQPRSELVCSVKNIILDSLKVEVDRRLGLAATKELDSSLALELDHVAEMVSLAVSHKKDLKPTENMSTSVAVCPLLEEDIVETISLAINDSVYLKKVLTVDVTIESSLAALKEYFSVDTEHDNRNSRGICSDLANNVEKEPRGQVSEIGSHKPVSRKQLYPDSDISTQATEKHEVANSYTIIAGAVTALGASTLLGHGRNEGPYNRDESINISSGDHSKSGNDPKELDASDKKGPKHIVSSLAEKAVSIAGPVVPTKSDGGLDQDRLVTMLSDLGQKGGVLKMLGKVALLWGGARGAVRLTDRLIAFLHIADRPLYQRLLGFACMVLVLWSPVVIPLFPTMVKAWATHNSTGIAEYVCIIGLYTAVAILVFLWGKRIRGYKDPLEQYGLDLTSKAERFDFSKGLMGGIMLVLSIHAINALLGYAHLSLSSFPSSSADAIKACGGLLVRIGQGIMTATVVVIVEEILFRSWLPEEISVDFGYHRAVIISGFAFSVLQRSLHSIPGLWLLSIALFGLKQRSKGSLSIPIGMRAGILASNFILQTGRFFIYHSSYPLWLVGTDPLQPFGGALGLAFCIMLAILFYPKKPQGTR